MTDHVLREDSEGIAVVTFNRPDKLNAVNRAMREELAKAVADLRDDPNLRMLLIRAKGRFFTAGVDLSEGGSADIPERASGIAVRRTYRLTFHALLDEIEKIEKPVMIAIHGPCLGLGVELAGSCDFRVAAASARFGLPEINIGVLAGSGGISRFTRLCGIGWSKWLSMAGEQIDAKTAQIAGFVQAIYPDEEFEKEVWALCKRIISKPAEPQGAAKLAIELAYDLDREGARHMERLINTPLMQADRSHLIKKVMK